ncbi:TrkH family potassium uptake protein [Betaproteobacteria bacterium PRO7]|jgi:trk system potassium uptake protein TrkH|nr:TrkH family potassium uptake protein [Betaproteobacteria bacterium PRO7]
MHALAYSLFPILNVLGLVVMLFAATMLVPLGVALVGGDKALVAYDNAFLITLASGAVMWFVTRRFKRELLPRDGFLLVSLVWTTLPAFATLPLIFHLPGLSFTDAYFEAMSGLTTTGATVLTGLDALPPSINVWRCLLQWLGGMGVIVLAVAILPLLGVGGTQLFRAESAGPIKDTKLTPRIAETAKGLWAVYALLSVACLIAYRAGGMSWLDAMMHMFTTMSLGGLSPHDASFAYFQSPLLEWIAVVFMLIASCNFALYFLVWRKRSIGVWLSDIEARGTIVVMVAGSLAVAVFLYWHEVYADWATALRHAAFNVVSIASTTGYASTDFNQWPTFAPWLMLFLCGLATSAGSTGGGIKMIRFIVLIKQAQREMLRVLHPRIVNPVHIRNAIVENNVIFAVLAFMLVYGASVIGLTMLLTLSGLDIITAFSAIVACINNMGPGLNQVGPASNYAVLNDFETWVCTFAMLIGRLELMSVLVLFTPAFWRK